MGPLRKPPEEWTDREIAIGLAELAKAMQWHTDQHHPVPGLVDALHAIAEGAANERDRRRRVARDEDLATTADITDLIRLEDAEEWPWPSS